MRPAFSLPVLLWALPLSAQASPEDFLAQVPAVPANAATATAGEREAFRKRMDDILASMDKRIQETRRSQDKAGKASAEALGRKMTGGMKRPSKQELAAMSPSEKMAFAMSQAGNVDPAAMAELQARGKATQRAVQVPREAQARMDRIARVAAKYEALHAEFKATANLGGGRDFSSRAVAVPPALRKRFTEKYAAILGEHMAAIREALPDFRRQAETAAEAAGMPRAGAVSVEALGAIRGYAARLKDIHRYGGE